LLARPEPTKWAIPVSVTSGLLVLAPFSGITRFLDIRVKETPVIVPPYPLIAWERQEETVSSEIPLAGLVLAARPPEKARVRYGSKVWQIQEDSTVQPGYIAVTLRCSMSSF